MRIYNIEIWRSGRVVECTGTRALHRIVIIDRLEFASDLEAIIIEMFSLSDSPIHERKHGLFTRKHMLSYHKISKLLVVQW